MVKFLRRSSDRYSKLGKRRKKKQKWKKPTGRDNKMREKRKGYPATVSIGYSTDKKERTLLKNKKPRQINNLKDLEKMKKNEIAVIGNVGKKKKIDIAKKILEMNIETYNINPKKYLKLNTKTKKNKEAKKEKAPEKGKEK